MNMHRIEHIEKYLNYCNIYEIQHLKRVIEELWMQKNKEFIENKVKEEEKCRKEM